MYEEDELKRCHEEIRRLTAENQDLRRASETFGYLAERLNMALRAERRLRETDRRQLVRDTPDRRTS